MVPMVRLVPIENEVIPMVLQVNMYLTMALLVNMLLIEGTKRGLRSNSFELHSFRYRA